MQDKVRTILVIEDEDAVRSLLRTLLRLAGYEVLSCQDGEEALDLMEARGGSIQLLITDVNLGTGMDGFEAAQALRSRLPTLKVLYMSGKEEADRLADRADANERFLLKPFTPRSFTDAVRAMLSTVRENAVS
ncbi:MAG: response regulator [Fibrobacteres bacterium]|jgi:two-component system cell cycle sensor histidine kinase/response regulator CckA|nr:response regulator [Fibrobacterota bacterium]